MRSFLKTRAVLLLAVLSLLCLSAVEPVFAEEGKMAPPSVRMEPFTTSTGKTQILIDAKVLMPKMSDLFLYRVEPKLFSEEDMQRILAGFEGLKNKKPKIEHHDDSGTVYKGFSSDEYEWKGKNQILYLHNDYMHGQPCGAHFNYERTVQKVEYFAGDFVLPFDAQASGTGADDFAGAQKVAKALASQINPELHLHTQGMISGSPIVFLGGSKEEKPLNTYAFLFLFSRELGGIPITITRNYTRMRNDLNAYMPSFLDERLSIVVKDGKVLSAHYENPYQLEQRERVDVDDLIPFDRVMETAKRMFPLMRLSHESYHATPELPDKLQIHRIEFGYARGVVKNKVDKYHLVPAWDFFGTVTYQAEGLHHVDEIESYLTINALTGEVLDRALGF